MQASIDYRQQTRRDARLRVDLELGLFVTLLGLILFLRITNILYNTLFVDEAIYATGGRDLLAGLADRHILAWFGGSFIYPTLSALAANLAGVAGIRLDQWGFIVTGHDLMHGGDKPKGYSDRDPAILETSIPGIFAAGDVRAGSTKQGASALGVGATAALLIRYYPRTT